MNACLELFPQAEWILVADCPLQYAEWSLMCRQSGLDRVIQKLSRTAPRKVQFRDLRKHAFKKDADNFLAESTAGHGDPNGYREVELGADSHLEPIADQARQFAVNDYSASVTRSNHRQGSHRYLVAQSFLEAELFINLHHKGAIALNDAYFYSLSQYTDARYARSYCDDIPKGLLRLLCLSAMGIFYVITYVRYPSRLLRTVSNVANNDAKTKLAAALIRVRKKREQLKVAASR